MRNLGKGAVTVVAVERIYAEISYIQVSIAAVVVIGPSTQQLTSSNRPKFSVNTRDSSLSYNDRGSLLRFVQMGSADVTPRHPLVKLSVFDTLNGDGYRGAFGWNC